MTEPGRDIETREDCERLVQAFYGRALSDPVIGFIFTDVARLDWHEQEARALGAEWAAAVERMRHDRCATADAQLEMLRTAGFADVSTHFADGRFAVLAGRRAR